METGRGESPFFSANSDRSALTVGESSDRKVSNVVTCAHDSGRRSPYPSALCILFSTLFDGFVSLRPLGFTNTQKTVLHQFTRQRTDAYLRYTRQI